MANQAGNDAGDRDGASGADRLSAPSDDTRTPRLPFPVVGVGASAGGLEAYTELLDAMPPDTGMAFVLVQHLPPERDSLIAEILSRHTTMPVAQVEDGQAVEPNRVYVIRPGHTLTIRDGRLRLGPELAARGHGRPVDDFFRSLAEEQQQRAVAVVLSGMGSNGTAGAMAVKTVGGLVVAQEPDTAKYPPMPRNVIDANLADFILRPAEMPDTLVRYARHPYAASEASAEVVVRHDRQAFNDILSALRTRTRHDFAGYRTATLLRRIQRRMGLTRVDTMGEYARLLRQTAGEVTALADDLLIHVTGFFRDPDAWEALRVKVVEPLAAERANGGTVRAWVSACATGEEAYSLAMLVIEAAEARGKRFDLKIFATDMAERALGHARAGVFPGGIESEIAPERLARFFDRDDAVYRVKKDLREAVIFAPQNILQDPPFSRLDVASCRNLLIYLEPDTQKRVLALLHFGLRDGGVLMLGGSESVGAAEADFEPLDKKHRLYRRVGATRHGAVEFPLPEPRPAPARTTGPPVAHAANRVLIEHFAPAAVVVDADGQVVHYHGDTGRYLRQPPGEPTRDVLTLATEQVRGAVRTALQRALGQERPVVVRDGLIETRDGLRRVEVTVAPLDRRLAAAHYLVAFTDRPEGPTAPPQLPEAVDPVQPAEARLSAELVKTRDELQGALEELQTSNEELKASHEEASSVNEELQSANEELETSKEELQSTNEELVTVNAQLQAKMAELEGTSSDLASLLTSTDIAVLFLDPRRRIRRYTPATKDLFDLIPSDVGRPLEDMRRKFADPGLLADAERVLERLVPIEREVASESGRTYLRRALPYRTLDNRIDGVVVAFVDITERRKAEAAVRASEEQFRRAIEEAPIPVIMQAEDGQVLQLSRTWTELTGYEPADLPTGDAWLTRGYGPGADALRAHVHELFAGERKALDVEFTIRTKAGADRRWSFSASAPGRLRDGRRFLVGMAVDVTARQQAEEAQRASEARLRLALAAARMGIWTLDADTAAHVRDANLNRMLGLEAVETTQPFAAFLGHIHPDDRDRVRAAFDASLGDGRVLNVEFRVVRPDGAVRWLHDQGDVFGAAAAGRRQMAGACVDVTERKGMEDELRAARDRLEERVTARTAEMSGAVEALETEMARRRELAQRLTTAQEDERKRVSRDLHDTVGQTHAALTMALRAAAAAVPARGEAADRLSYAAGLAEAMSRELHQAAVRLRPTALDDIGLGPAVAELVGQWTTRTGVPAEFQSSGLDGERLPAGVETALYRVVQEALTNVARHARARAVSVTVTRADGEVRAVVEDDGVGFDPDTGTSRLGLAGMRERVELVGGALELESAAGAGTTVIARVPVP